MSGGKGNDTFIVQGRRQGVGERRRRHRFGHQRRVLRPRRQYRESDPCRRVGRASMGPAAAPRTSLSAIRQITSCSAWLEKISSSAMPATTRSMAATAAIRWWAASAMISTSSTTLATKCRKPVSAPIWFRARSPTPSAPISRISHCSTTAIWRLPRTALAMASAISSSAIARPTRSMASAGPIRWRAATATMLYFINIANRQDYRNSRSGFGQGYRFLRHQHRQALGQRGERVPLRQRQYPRQRQQVR